MHPHCIMLTQKQLLSKPNPQQQMGVYSKLVHKHTCMCMQKTEPKFTVQVAMHAVAPAASPQPIAPGMYPQGSVPVVVGMVQHNLAPMPQAIPQHMPMQTVPAVPQPPALGMQEGSA